MLAVEEDHCNKKLLILRYFKDEGIRIRAMNND